MLNPARPAARIMAAALSAVLLGAAVWFGSQLILDLRAQQREKTALAELRDVKYGLFNAELWVEQVGEILALKIDTFEITDQNRPRLKQAVEQVLDRLLIEVEGYLRRRNASGDNWLERVQGGLQQRLQEWLVDFDSLRARAPQYADQVLQELEQPHTKAELKTYLSRLLDQAATTSLAEVDYSAFNGILDLYGCETGVVCARQLTAQIETRDQLNRPRALLVLALILALFAVNLFLVRRQGRLDPEVLGFLTGAVLVLLAVGVLTPMLEIEARITELSFQLLGEPVRFTDQVLYFQSKSIIDVVTLLARTGSSDMILVAVLITLFSLVFPTLKILASLVHYRGRLRQAGPWRAAVRFFALRSGKWSMADVLVVALFMAYIGFDGLIESQLRVLAPARAVGAESGALVGASSLDILTTNGTRLGIGFFMFLAFVLGSLVISTLLDSDSAIRQPEPEQPDLHP